jgi:hypothetical protein
MVHEQLGAPSRQCTRAHRFGCAEFFGLQKHDGHPPPPPYSPDLAPCDFFLFPKMKIKLKGRKFDTVEEIQAKLQKVLNTLTQKDFQDSFRSWQKRWDRCVRSQGDYFEGDSGD